MKNLILEGEFNLVIDKPCLIRIVILLDLILKIVWNFGKRKFYVRSEVGKELQYMYV